MYWSSLGDFLAMGGHAAFIWPAFAVALVLLAALALSSLRSARDAERDHAEARREGGRAAGDGAAP